MQTPYKRKKPPKLGAVALKRAETKMLGDLSGPTLLVLIAVVLVVIAAAVTAIIVVAVKKSNRNRAQQQAELQRAYEAGLNTQRQP